VLELLLYPTLLLEVIVCLNDIICYLIGEHLLLSLDFVLDRLDLCTHLLSGFEVTYVDLATNPFELLENNSVVIGIHSLDPR
jgi:hypothetical protein